MGTDWLKLSSWAGALIFCLIFWGLVIYFATLIF